FGDLNLSNPADTRVLNSRIENAAEAACASLKAPSMFYKTWHARCVSNATARVSAQIASLSSGKYRTFASK
ncbi:MAG TPA: UrcA family protein, partial [Rhizomicrobium sp.]|nr:UrcA family protein [Rhizomicrobium sp.]